MKRLIIVLAIILLMPVALAQAGPPVTEDQVCKQWGCTTAIKELAFKGGWECKGPFPAFIRVEQPDGSYLIYEPNFKACSLVDYLDEYERSKGKK